MSEDGGEEPVWQQSSMEQLLRDNPAMANALRRAAEQRVAQGPQMGDLTHGKHGQSTMGWIGDSAPSMNGQGGNANDIFLAAGEGDSAAVDAFLDAGASVDAADGDGRTALHWAADRGHIAVVELLLDRGASVDSTDGEGQTALHYATLCEFPEIAVRLASAGASLEATDDDGSTPLENASGDAELCARMKRAAEDRQKS